MITIKRIEELAKHRLVPAWVIKLVQDCVEDEGKRLVWACEEARNFNKSFEWLNGFDACAAVLNAERIEL